MIQNKFSIAIIVSFVTGRLYHMTQAPTELFAELGKYLIGRYPMTHELPGLKKEYKVGVIGACPKELQTILETWEHSEDWEQRIQQLQEIFGDIEFRI